MISEPIIVIATFNQNYLKLIKQNTFIYELFNSFYDDCVNDDLTIIWPKFSVNLG